MLEIGEGQDRVDHLRRVRGAAAVVGLSDLAEDQSLLTLRLRGSVTCFGEGKVLV